MKEMWKDIPGYEGLYQVSNLGNIRSLKYAGGNKVKLLKQATTNGYKQVQLSKNGKGKNHLVHRLVAIAFIPNPNNLPVVNHKDENPSNNNVDNLEWCTQEYNINYGTRNERASESMKGENNPCYGKHLSEEHRKKLSKKMRGENNPNYGKKGKNSPNAKPILMYDREGNFIKRFDSIGDAYEHFGKARDGSIIGECLNGRKNTAYNHIFVYVDEDQDIIKNRISKASKKKKKPILMYDKEGNFIRRFECIKDTIDYFGNKNAYSNVSMCLTGRAKTAYGYVFVYAKENN